MVDPVEYYGNFSIGGTSEYDGETVLVVRGATVADVVEALSGVAPSDVPAAEWDSDDLMWSTYRLVAIDGGVLATEDTGYADPPNSALVAWSEHGRAAAVVRHNIQAHDRFACARDGKLLFDSDEYIFVRDDVRASVPEDLRSLFDRAWIGLDDDAATAVDEAEEARAVGLAMAEIVTGIRLTASDAAKLTEGTAATVVAVRTMRYAAEVDSATVDVPDLRLHEAAAGLAAAARIGNDVDQGPGARALSGRLGTARAHRVFSRSPAWHAEFFGQVYVLTHDRGNHIAKYAGTPWDRTNPNAPHWTFCAMRDATFPDRITGWEAVISTLAHPDNDPPRESVLWWKWVKRTPPTSPHGNWWNDVTDEPVLAQDTVRVARFRWDAVEKATTIEIEHRDVPEEWVDDLSDWWAFQLAIHELRT